MKATEAGTPTTLERVPPASLVKPVSVETVTEMLPVAGTLVVGTTESALNDTAAVPVELAVPTVTVSVSLIFETVESVGVTNALPLLNFMSVEPPEAESISASVPLALGVQNLNPDGAVKVIVLVARAPIELSVITGPFSIAVQVSVPPVYDDVSRDIEVLRIICIR